LEIKLVNSLILSPRGKYQMFISNVEDKRIYFLAIAGTGLGRLLRSANVTTPDQPSIDTMMQMRWGCVGKVAMELSSK